MPPDLKISASADLGNSISQLDKFTLKLETVGKAATNLNAPFAKIPSVLNTASVALAKTAIEANKLDSALGKGLVRGSNTAGQSLINLGRIAQDAPFGFIGIQNNINPLIESFGRLRAETGSIGGAFKSLAGSLGGAAGIGLAVSVVTGLLTVFSDEIFGGSKAVEELDFDLVELSKTINDSKNEIAAFTKETQFLQKLGDINLRVNFSSDKERTLLSLQSANIDARETTNKLLGEEKKLADAASVAFNKLQKEGKQGTIDLISIFSTLRDIPESAIADLGKKDAANFKVALAAEKAVLDIQEKIVDSRNNESLVSREISATNAENARKEAEERAKKLKDMLTIQKVLNAMNAELVVLGKKEDLFGTIETKAKISEVEKTIDTLFTKFKLAANDPLIIGLFSKILDFDTPDLTKIKFDTVAKLPATFEAPKPSALKEFNKAISGLKIDPIPVTIQLEKQRLKELSDSISNTLTSTFTDTFSQIGEIIGAAISGGDIQSALSGFVNILASGLDAIGKAMIQFGVAKQALKSFAKLNPALAIGIGIGLTALGAALKNSINTQKFADGGYVSGPGSGRSDSIPARLSNGEFVVRESAVSKFGVGFLNAINNGFLPRFSGGGLVGSNNGLSIGGGQNIGISGNFEVSGNNLRLVLERANNTFYRNT